MNPLTIIMVAFAMLGALDRIIGNKFGLGKEFERGIMMLGPAALSMIGMLVLAPAFASVLQPALTAMAEWLPIDPSVIPAMLLANDMGGEPLSNAVAIDPQIGAFNGLVVSSMMGCTVSFTIPFALSTVPREHHKALLVGLLCGIVTIPVGCLVGGLVAGVPILALLLDLAPLILFSALIAVGLLRAPEVCVKIFSVIGFLIKALITVGLAIGIFTMLTGIEILPGAGSFESAAEVVFRACAVMAGAFPMLFCVSWLLKRPFGAIGNRLQVSENAMTGLVSMLASSAATFDMLKDMNHKGRVLNSAFSVSAAFLFAAHLAYTMAVDPSYLPAVMIGKVVAGVSAFALTLVLYDRIFKKGDIQ
ncbi:MAG: ethanolamine utilization protein EutH [Clostridia bacterium]|nr:ethanolamine utilization protein EutH [Clostridia bacterium]